MSQNCIDENYKLVHDKLDGIYQNHVKDSSEHNLNHNSVRLFQIADSIAEARENHLKSQTTHRAEIKNKFIKSISMMLLGRDWRPVPLTERILKDKESSIGASIFGPVMPNTRREFWNDNRIHWYFHQSINTPSGVSEQTLRYEVSPTRPTGVLRVISEEKMKYFDADGVDLENFLKATEEYHKRVMREIYGIEPKDAKKHQ